MQTKSTSVTQKSPVALRHAENVHPCHSPKVHRHHFITRHYSLPLSSEFLVRICFFCNRLSNFRRILQTINSAQLVIRLLKIELVRPEQLK